MRAQPHCVQHSCLFFYDQLVTPDVTAIRRQKLCSMSWHYGNVNDAMVYLDSSQPKYLTTVYWHLYFISGKLHAYQKYVTVFLYNWNNFYSFLQRGLQECILLRSFWRVSSLFKRNWIEVITKEKKIIVKRKVRQHFLLLYLLGDKYNWLGTHTISLRWSCPSYYISLICED